MLLSPILVPRRKGNDLEPTVNEHICGESIRANLSTHRIWPDNSALARCLFTSTSSFCRGRSRRLLFVFLILGSDLRSLCGSFFLHRGSLGEPWSEIMATCTAKSLTFFFGATLPPTSADGAPSSSMADNEAAGEMFLRFCPFLPLLP